MDSLAYRRVIGHFATGVTVITTAVGGRLHGMTANAVASVSLEPLLLLVCVDRAAHAREELLRAERFALSILAAEQETVARRFAERGEPERGSLRGIPFDDGPHGCPVIRGCLAYVECELADRLEAGDHTVFIGSVLGGEARRDGPPLLFYRGQYWQP